MKKILALILAIMLLAGICTACQQGGTSQPASSKAESTEASSKAPEKKDPVKLRYYYRNPAGEQEYTKQVADAMNQLLANIEGCEHITIELVPVKSGDYQTTFTLDETSGAQIDLVSTYNLDYSTLADAGSFLDLSDLLAQHPAITDELPEWLIQMGLYKGTQYMIPTYQRATNGHFFVTPNAYLEAANMTADEIRNIFQKGTLTEKLDFLENYCRAVREGTKIETKYITRLKNLTLFQVEFIGDNFGQLLLRNGADGPEFWPLTDDAKTCFEYAARWYQEGLIHPDVATYNGADFAGKNILNDQSVIFECHENTGTEEQVLAGINWAQDIPATAINMHDGWYIGSTWAAGGNAIHSTCKNPDDAMKIIELLMTEKGKEFYNQFIWGIEGIHWEWEDKANERIKTLEFSGSQGGADTTYSTWKWNVGNTFNAWKNQAVPDGMNEFILDEVHNGKSTVTSKMMGYTWDLTGVQDQISNIRTVVDEYNESLQNGIHGADWEAKYNEYVQKLKAAGVDTVLETVTKQYNDYQASKK